MHTVSAPARALAMPKTGKRRFGSHVSMAMLSLAIACSLAAAPRAARAASLGSVVDTHTDNDLYRATHNALVAVARAGDRLVAVGDRAMILLSDDEGKTWRLAKTEGHALLTTVMFVNPQEGYAAGQDETILKTSDGGATWARQYYKEKADRNVFSLTRDKQGTLIATGAYALALSSTDGTTWSEIKLPTFDDDYHLNCAMAVGDDLVITGEGGHAFLRRADAWVSIPVPYLGSQFGCLSAKDGTIYSFGLRGSLFRAHLPDTIPAPPPVAKAEAGDPAVTPVAEIKDLWTRIDTGGQRPIFGGIMLDDGKLALVGATGQFLLLDPANGDKLTTIPTGSEQAISAVVPTRDGAYVIVGDAGVKRVSPDAVPTAAGDAAQGASK